MAGTVTATGRNGRANRAPEPEPEELIEDPIEEQIGTSNEPSRTLILQKVQTRIVGLLERTLGDDEEGKRRVIRATEALLGLADF